jgi:hypothetical protein
LVRSITFAINVCGLDGLDQIYLEPAYRGTGDVNAAVRDSVGQPS